MLNLKNLNFKKTGFFRFKEFNNKYLLTNDTGNYIFLSKEEFNIFIAGKIKKDEEIYEALRIGGYIKDETDFHSLTEKFYSRNLFLKSGTSLHIIVVTLRCNFNCIYCQTTSQHIKKKEFDMDIETAKRVVDMIFKSSNNTIIIELQGGEPLLNWDTVKFIVEYSLEKRKQEKKGLLITLVSNFSLLTEDKLDYLITQKVALCTSIDGPDYVHNKNRGKNYRIVKEKLSKVMKEYKEKYESHIPGALPTITKYSLPYFKEIIDEYVNLGLENIHLRYVTPLGCAKNKITQIGYSINDFIDFYKKGLDYIIEINKKGTFFKERFATIFLTKILTDNDPQFLDISSPCGAAIGQLAYNYNGDVYTCDEGRMLAMMGDTSFKLGNVKENTYNEIMNNEIVKTMCIASCLDGLPGCSNCVYKPYCGTCPVLNYAEEGNIFSQIASNERCKLHKNVLDYLFMKLQDENAKDIFNSWVQPRK